MFNSRWILLAAFMSVSSFASSPMQFKKMQIDSLMKLKDHAPMLAFEAYERELEYEERGLSLEERAKNEVNLLADKVRSQVVMAYDEAIKLHKNAELAREEIKSAIEADLELAAPELRDEIRRLALETLDNIENGAASLPLELPSFEEVMQKNVLGRMNFLKTAQNLMGDPVTPKSNASKDAEKKDYKTKSELVSSLVSDRESSRWISTGAQTIKTAQVMKSESKISLQVKMEFLGATIEAGPKISFSRDFTTDAVIVAEGFAPVIRSDGNFDRVKRDSRNEPVKKNGKVVPRYIAFYCNAELKFANDVTVGGGLKYMGAGADASVSSRFESSVNIQSRRLALPESVQGKAVTVKYLSELCHNDYLKGRYSNNTTVGESLNTLMKNVVSGLVYSNTRTTCARDSDCSNWYQNEVIALKKKNNVARCVEHIKEKYRFCQLRGKVGQKCHVIENGKVTSSGVNEYFCDWGLRCVKTESASYIGSWRWSDAEGVCRK